MGIRNIPIIEYTMKTDAWKRPLPSAVDDCADVTSGYEHQLEFQFKPRNATPKEFDEWQETELNWWAEKQLNFVAIASLIQLSALGFMLTSFYFLSQAFSP
tara:strand:- start:111 stop:413 length:303 start_codon:yes stop_codon:yes gene_type:complete